METIILRCVGLVWVISGASSWYIAFRKARRAAAEKDAVPESSPAGGWKPAKSGWPRPGDLLGGLFWVALGIATLAGAFTLDMIAFFLPCLGLSWIVLGTWTLCSIFRSAHPDRKREKARARFAPFLLILGLATLWLSDFRIGTTPAAVSQPPEASSPLADTVTEAVEREFERQGHIGVVVGAVADDQDVLLGFGNQRLWGSEPPDADTVFEIGSISKAFTGILLAKRVESGDLKLDDRVADLLPEGWSLSEPARTITLQHLTTHTSGFPRIPDNLLGVGAVFMNLMGGDPYRAYSEESFRAALSSVDLVFEPGTDRLYSNFAVGLLGFVLATRNGTDYETLLTTELCEPLGMKRTAITNQEWHNDHFAAGYRTTAKLGPVTPAMGSSEWLLPNHLAGAGGIRSTGSDMLTFLKANMGLVSTPLDGAILLSHQELYKEYDQRAMGMNWIRSFDQGLSQNILWHNGGTGGYRSYLGFSEDLRFGVVILSNTSHSVDGLGDRILRELFEEYTDPQPAANDDHAEATLPAAQP